MTHLLAFFVMECSLTREVMPGLTSELTLTTTTRLLDLEMQFLSGPDQPRRPEVSSNYFFQPCKRKVGKKTQI